MTNTRFLWSLWHSTQHKMITQFATHAISPDSTDVALISRTLTMSLISHVCNSDNSLWSSESWSDHTFHEPLDLRYIWINICDKSNITLNNLMELRLPHPGRNGTAQQWPILSEHKQYIFRLPLKWAEHASTSTVSPTISLRPRWTTADHSIRPFAYRTFVQQSNGTLQATTKKKKDRRTIEFFDQRLNQSILCVLRKCWRKPFRRVGIAVVALSRRFD